MTNEELEQLQREKQAELVLVLSRYFELQHQSRMLGEPQASRFQQTDPEYCELGLKIASLSKEISRLRHKHRF